MPRCKVNYRKWYESNKDNMRLTSKKRFTFMIKLIGRWKQFKGCAICGFNSHSAALDLDHINDNSTKPTSGHALRYEWSKKRVKKELSKCQVLCANCHRVKTQKDKPVSVRS